MNQTPRSRIAPPPLARAALLAALALALGPSSAAAQDPAGVVDAAIPHDSAISEQYQRVQEVLDQAAAVVPEAPPAPPAAESAPPPAPEPQAPPPAPEAAPKPKQYHSESTPNVSVTQEQPSNVNVSIRINSPGDDGPVVQINNAGGSTVVEQTEQVVERPPAAPEPAQPAGGHLPDTWEWVWTSACFGGAPQAGAATATPGWSWRWSCEEADDGAENVIAGIGVVPDGVLPDVDEVIAAAVPTFAAAPLTAAAGPARPRARPEGRRDRPRRSSAAGGGAGPPPAAGGGPPRAGPSPASAHAPPARPAHPRHAARAEARARPDDGPASNTSPGGDGPTLGASSALGGVAALLLGIWTAVLVTACVLVVPRLRHRRWSGLTWRLPRLSSTRLERPG